ncbi:MAG TPA: MarR family transcriptional regulator [Lentisphaeria bacterium]|nr:MarR family transcriptional regulator [Lentisphaeria bacterium]
MVTLTKQYQERILTRLLVKYGIDEFNGPQGRILYVLWNSNSISIQELAQQTGLANATLTSMLDRMEQKNLLRRTADPGDRRKIRILLTEQAFGLREKYEAVTAAITGITYQGFSEEEIKQLESYMERVLRNVQNFEKQPNQMEVSK